MKTDRGLQFGVDWRYVSAEDHRQNFAGAFLQYLFTFDEKWDVLLGGRFDLWENRTTQGTFNPRAGLVFRASNAVTVRASAYRGFRAPSLNELYRPFRLNVLTDANPDPPRSTWGLEGASISIRTARFVRLNGFTTPSRIRSRTLPSADSALYYEAAQNLGAHHPGFEAEAIHQPAPDGPCEGLHLLRRGRMRPAFSSRNHPGTRAWWARIRRAVPATVDFASSETLTTTT
jgi:outer membrane receptor protein involved in Fe transport